MNADPQVLLAANAALSMVTQAMLLVDDPETRPQAQKLFSLAQRAIRVR